MLRFRYTDDMVMDLGRIEAARAVIDVLPLPPDVSLKWRHQAFQNSTRHSTAIEGIRITDEIFWEALATGGRSGTQAEQEVRNYWIALEKVEDFAASRAPLSEDFIQQLHRIVIVRGAGRRGSRSSYRTTECPVVDSISRRIEYAPPEPKDVPPLMKALVTWLHSTEAQAMPAPLRAGLLAHRFLSIHPFDDGNGRTGRLLATAELWRSGYRMRGFLSFDEYFNADRERYYQNIQMGLSFNFYDGRHDPDHTPWLAYFVGVLAQASSSLHAKALRLIPGPLQAPWETLHRRQQQVLTWLMSRVLAHEPQPFVLTTQHLIDWFGISDKTAREWLQEWAEDAFIVPLTSGAAQRIRRYELAGSWQELLKIAEVEDPR